ncbi:hypothetical protein AOLI_G00098380 [Acnodon oligacanthus]
MADMAIMGPLEGRYAFPSRLSNSAGMKGSGGKACSNSLVHHRRPPQAANQRAKCKYKFCRRSVLRTSWKDVLDFRENIALGILPTPRLVIL